MKSLIFLVRKNIKNFILDLAHHPAKMIGYLLVVVFLLFILIMNLTMPQEESQEYAGIEILHVIYFALLTLFVVTGGAGGVSKGGSFFKMSDVNLLFPSPISPRKILVYGLFRTLGTTLAISFFILFYGGMLRNIFGITTGQTVLIMVGYLFVLFISQILTLVIYIYTSGDERRGRLARAGIIALVAIFLVYLYISASALPGGATLQNLLKAGVEASAVFPISGWAAAAVFRLIGGDAGGALLFGALTLAGLGGLLAALALGKPDYYEDVLQSAETAMNTKQAAKEGRLVDPSDMKKTRVNKKTVGLRAGQGASAFFYKHLKEARRKSRLMFVDIFTVITAAVCIFLPRFMGGGEDGMTANFGLGVAAISSVYILFFSTAMGSWTREMTKPYLYLVPEAPMKKLLWGTATSLMKPLIDGLIAFGLGAAVNGASFEVAAACYLLYVSFGAIFVASNVLSQRILGHMVNKGLIMVLYMLLLALVLAPGVTVGCILVFAMELPKVLGLLCITGWNLLVAAAVYLGCRNILHTMEAA